MAWSHNIKSRLANMNARVYAASREHKKYQSAAWICLLIFTSIIFIVYIHDFDWHEPRLSLGDFLSGTAHKPFAYRILVPMVTKWGQPILQVKAEFIAASIMYCCLIGFVIVLRHLLLSVWRQSLIVDLTVFTTLVAAVPAMVINRKIYDFATLLSFASALNLLRRSRLGLFLLLFPVISLNKETSILLILFFAVHFWRKISFRAYATLLLGQLFIYAALRILLFFVFIDNPGGVGEIHLGDHLEALKLGPGWALLYALPLISVVVLMLTDLKTKPHFIRNASLTILLAQIILYPIFGTPWEIRFFFESLPVISMMMVQPLGRLLGIDVEFVN